MNLSTDTITLIYIAAGLLAATLAAVLTVLTVRQSRHRRLVREQSAPLDNAAREWPRLSVIVVGQKLVPGAEEGLLAMLAQDYPRFEVVVVDASTTTEIEDLVKRLRQSHESLRRTFVPTSGHIADLMQMALMIGSRSAWADHLVVTQLGAIPRSEEWLRRMARHLGEEADCVVGKSTPRLLPNVCIGKARLANHNYRLTQAAKPAPIAREWSPQAQIYQGQ